MSANAGRSVALAAKVDTGAMNCIFQREYADQLGINVETGLNKIFTTAAGHFETYGHTVTLACFEYEFESLVYFAAQHEFSRNVLGLQGWLDKLRFGLVHHDGLMLVSHYDD